MMTSPVAKASFSRQDVVAMLASALGQEKAGELIDAAARKLGLHPTSLSREQVLSLLDHLAQQPGLPGITARFAKARVILK